jgi:hypothetical protein
LALRTALLHLLEWLQSRLSFSSHSPLRTNFGGHQLY